PLRECAEIIKNDAHRVFTAFMVREFVPHARQSCAGVEETGYSHRFLWARCYSFLDYPDAIHAGRCIRRSSWLSG
ncbi:hypothetical protein OM190_25005, partial [Escherichia albertii]|nr:hypothetical protein [Escherichia albertii]MCZ8998690.1 hypothetical protein [Escherichia albertii]MCZ9008809.1 hypothetical protein [Escherichia albertii]MCZ9027389.1 hypothetical protein [Escherichia albertii]MCZ9056187.1 hypothetical protein [Escherichia albertii]